MSDSLRISQPGIYDIPEAIYHADPCVEPSLSSSGARLIVQKSPYHFWHRREKPHLYTGTQPMRFGTAIHMKVLEPERFERCYHILPKGFSWTKTRQQEEWHAEANAAIDLGKTVLSHTDMQDIDGMSEAMGQHADTLAKFMSAPKEQSAFWFDGDFKIWRRARFDFLPRGGRLFADYKSTPDISNDALKKTIWSYRLDQQAVWYMDAARALGLAEDPVFLLIFQEKKPPHQVAIRFLDHVAIQHGQIANARAMDQFARGQDTGIWPGPDAQPEEISLPIFAEYQIEEAKQSGAFELIYRKEAPWHGYQGD